MKRNLLLGLSLPLLGACAGPSTPFGALNEFVRTSQLRALAGDGIRFWSDQVDSTDQSETNLITATPGFFLAHRPFVIDLKVAPESAVDPLAHIHAYYNGVDVTSSFKRRAWSEKKNHGEWNVTIPDIKVNPSEDINIKFRYVAPSGVMQTISLSEPTCGLEFTNPVVAVERFKIEPDLLNELNRQSREHRLSPHLVSAIIAQESGFNPSAVSWAKAMGLTQVTPIAEEEIIQEHPTFPRYPGLNQMSVPAIKTLLEIGIINPQNEWRFNPKQSIQGAISFIKYIREYWAKAEPVIANADLKILLASYNSGPARVRYAREKHKDRWLASQRLGSAKKYINMVSSYCQSFQGLGGVQQ